MERNDERVVVRFQKSDGDPNAGTATKPDGRKMHLTFGGTHNSLQSKRENADRSHAGELGYKLPRDIDGIG